MSAAAKDAPRTLLEYLQVTATFLAGKGVEGARLDAELLLAETVGMTRTQLYTNFEQPLAAPEVARFRELVRRRAAREPVAYITGRREFWSLDFTVDRRVLVPRPETELVVELAVDVLRAGLSGADLVAEAAPPAAGTSALRVADIGTGSGAIAVAIAREIPSVRVIATDRSEAALEIAPGNAERHGVADRIEFRTGDGCIPLAGAGPFAVIASNPPYICRGEMKTLEPEVRDWEPQWALEAGSDGMDVTAPLVEAAYDLLAPGGSLIVEVGTQAALVRECFVQRGYENIQVRRDLAGLDRVVVGRRPG
ncbi:MAG: peptide chain release factor N(5)-glutamine methyltransferase [Candidatus Binatia bacterium]